jgi:hypothetical protein
MAASWDGKEFAHFSPSQLRFQLDTFISGFPDNRARGASLFPRGGIGLYLDHGAAAYRNVLIEPTGKRLGNSGGHSMQARDQLIIHTPLAGTTGIAHGALQVSGVLIRFESGDSGDDVEGLASGTGQPGPPNIVLATPDNFGVFTLNFAAAGLLAGSVRIRVRTKGTFGTHVDIQPIGLT